jgi:hypothetical protein
MRITEMPDTRITVYSELATSCASANSVPISTAMGKSSYTWFGSESTTCSSEILDLLDEIEKGEQHQQRREHQCGRGDDLARQIAAQRPHRISRKSENTITLR